MVGQSDEEKKKNCPPGRNQPASRNRLVQESIFHSFLGANLPCSPDLDAPTYASSSLTTLPSRNNCTGRPVGVFSSRCGSMPRQWNSVAEMSSGVHASV